MNDAPHPEARKNRRSVHHLVECAEARAPLTHTCDRVRAELPASAAPWLLLHISEASSLCWTLCDQTHARYLVFRQKTREADSLTRKWSPAGAFFDPKAPLVSVDVDSRDRRPLWTQPASDSVTSLCSPRRPPSSQPGCLIRGHRRALRHLSQHANPLVPTT